MKKLLSVVLIMLMVFSMAACGESGSEEGTNYPNGTITNIVNFAAGGGTDICDRALVEAVAAELGCTITTSNVTGGSGSVGLAELVKQPADGMTIGVGTLASLAVVPSQIEVSYTPEDFEYICAWGQYGYGVVASKDYEYQDINALIEAAKTKTIKFGATCDYPQPIPMNYLNEHYGTNFEYVYYPSTTDLVTDVLGGFVDLALADEASFTPYVKSGEMTLLAGAGDDRWINVQDVPTLLELGLVDETGVVRSYIGQVVPAGTDPEIVTILRDAFRAAAQNETYLGVMTNAGQHIVYMEGEEFEEMIKTTYADYKAMVGK